MIRFAVIAVISFAIFGAGYQVKSWMVKSELADALQEQKTAFELLDAERLLKATDLEDQLAEARQKKEIRYVEKQKIINRPVYRECKLDADGVQFIGKQINETNTAREHAYGLRAD